MNRSFGFVFLICLVTQASLVAGVEAELSGFTKANALNRPLPLAQYRSPSVIENDVSDNDAYEEVDGNVAGNGNVVEEKEVQVSGNDNVVAPNSTRIENNNINVNKVKVVRDSRLAYASPRYAKNYGDEADGIIAGGARVDYRQNRIGLMPMIGVNTYVGRWNQNTVNPYALGLVLDIPVSSMFSTEIEGSYASYRINYLVNNAINFVHDFNQYSLGANGKVYLIRGIFRPYVGAGLAGVRYENMAYGPFSPLRYDQWIVSGQLMGGADIEVSEGISIGGRASWMMPLFNRPFTLDNGFQSAPGFEEAALINTSYYRLMGTMKVAF